MATSVMILRVLEQDFGVRLADHFDFTLGHSLGEFAALVAGAYLPYPTALHICHQRALEMARCTVAASAATGAVYGMVALICEPAQQASLLATIEAFLLPRGVASSPSPSSSSSGEDLRASSPPIHSVTLANLNARSQLVLSGDIAQIHLLLLQLRQFAGHDPRAVRLRADAPFHSPVMAPAATLTRRLLLHDGAAPMHWPGRFPLVSNVSARPARCAAELLDLVAGGCVHTVRWGESIGWLEGEAGVRRWVGVGPGVVGRNLVGKEVRGRGRGVWGLSGPGDVEGLLRGLEETAGGVEGG
ncbi:hypothetical protein MMC26_002906 [Xylographa opegraphella]|nr:hypothetical protein [Xylographa opegraphella]